MWEVARTEAIPGAPRSDFTSGSAISFSSEELARHTGDRRGVHPAAQHGSHGKSRAQAAVYGLNEEISERLRVRIIRAQLQFAGTVKRPVLPQLYPGAAHSQTMSRRKSQYPCVEGDGLVIEHRG